MEKRRNCSLGAISPLFHNIFLLGVRFSCLGRTRFSLQDKRLFEISEVEITRVNCIYMIWGKMLIIKHSKDADKRSQYIFNFCENQMLNSKVIVESIGSL